MPRSRLRVRLGQVAFALVTIGALALAAKGMVDEANPLPWLVPLAADAVVTGTSVAAIYLRLRPQRYTVLVDASSSEPNEAGRIEVDVSLNGYQTRTGALLVAKRARRRGAKAVVLNGSPEAIDRKLTAAADLRASLRRLPPIL